MGHDSIIDQHVNQLSSAPTVSGIRKNQQQVDINGNTVGKNRPDIQFKQNGVHHNIEYDTTTSGSAKHQAQIPSNDPKARNTFWNIDHQGKTTGGHSKC